MAFFAAHPLHLALLEHPQQLGLEAKGHFGNFVEKQRAVLGLFKLSGLGTHGPREGTFLVAEEGRLEQGVGNRRAVDGDEWPRAARGLLVEIAGKDFLAGTGFTGKEHGGIGFGHLVGQGQQVAGVRVGGDHAVIPTGCRVTLHVLEQHIGFERFHQKITGSAAHGIDGFFDVTEGGHQQNR